MAKTTVPILSMGARGQVGKKLIYSRRRGTDYAKGYVVPDNPRSVAQVKARNVMGWLESIWRRHSLITQERWNSAARGQKFTGRNLHIKSNLSALKNGIDSRSYVTMPKYLNGPSVASIGVSGGAGVITLRVFAPDIPTGWTTSGATGVVFLQQLPDGEFEGTLRNNGADVLTTGAYQFSFSALTAGTYTYSAYLRYLTASGKSAFSVALTGSRVVT